MEEKQRSLSFEGPKLGQIVLEKFDRISQFEYNYEQFITTLKEIKHNKIERREATLLENGSVYIGEWDTLTNTRTGRGKIIYKNGALFEGLFKNNDI
jgi:hypothetical protein